MERRLAAILAADVVGYSRLMEADEEATVGLLNTCWKFIDDRIDDYKTRISSGAYPLGGMSANDDDDGPPCRNSVRLPKRYFFPPPPVAHQWPEWRRDGVPSKFSPPGSLAAIGREIYAHR